MKKGNFRHNNLQPRSKNKMYFGTLNKSRSMGKYIFHNFHKKM
jgi:hypothetical protein